MSDPHAVDFSPFAAHDQQTPHARRLWQQWRQGQCRGLQEFLAQVGELTATQLVAVLQVDQRECWLRGERVLAEAYLREHPLLPSAGDHALDLVYGEYLLREQLGEAPQVGEYLRRFPQFAEELRLQIDFHHALASGTLPETVRLPGDAVVEDSEAPAVPGYEILGRLGQGGMGVVYKARQLSLKRLVALKMMLVRGHTDREALLRFRAEAEAVARFQHPNIVQIHEVGEHAGRPYFAMEFVAGGSLAQHLNGTPLPSRQAAALAETLARAMHYAHERGIVHRDLKPANILLPAEEELTLHPNDTGGQAQEEQGQGAARESSWDSSFRVVRVFRGFSAPKITDFGLAKRLHVETGQTQSGAILGTPSYMAPEQAQGNTRAIGPATDVYALGALLYECLTGRPPFKAATVLETLEQVRSAEPVPPTRLQPKVLADLETICLKCLHKDPRQRYPSARELADDLGRFRAGEPIHARPVSVWGRVLKWARRRPLAAALVSVSVGSLFVLLAVSLWFNAQLQAALQQTREAWARAETQQAEVRRQEAGEHQRLAAVRAEGQEWFLKGQAAFAKEDWQQAKLCLASALARMRAEPPLADLTARAERMLAETDRYQTFVQRRDEALFHLTLLTGLDLSGDLQQTRAAAAEALALFGVAIDNEAVPAVDGTYFNERRRAEITAGCYELLLVWAEGVAQAPPEQPVEPPSGRARQALRILDRAAHLGPPTRAYHQRRARYLEQLGDGPGARQECVRAAALQPTSAVDYFLVGQERYRRGDPAEAVRDFEAALRLQPDHFWAQYFLAICHLKLQRPAEAKANLTACLSRRPDFLWIYLLRGFAQGELGEFEAAAADFQKAQKALDGAPDPSARYVLHVNRGVLAIRQEKFAAAVAELRQAITLKPQQYQAYLNLAEAYRQQQQWDEAIAQLDRAVAVAPTRASLYRSRARLQLRRHDLPAALRDLEQAIDLEPAGSTAVALAEDHVERGRILYRGRRYEEAIQDCEAALQVHPDHGPALRLRAEALLALNRHPEAIQALDQYLRHGEPRAEVYQVRGLARAKLGQYAGALDDYTRALELEADPATHAYRGWIYLLVYEAPRLALQDFEEALRLDPDNGDALNGRGYARVQLGHWRPALADAEAALHQGPESPRLRYNAARIFAQAAGKAEAEAGLANRQALPLRSEHQERALTLIRQALDLLPAQQRPAFWRDYIQSDAALSPIRRSPAFAQLAAEYSRPAP